MQRDPEMLRIIRNEILLTARNCQPCAASLRVMAGLVRGVVPSLTPEEIEVETRYLQDAGYLAPAPQPMSPGLKFWTLTVAGRDYLTENNLG